VGRAVPKPGEGTIPEADGSSLLWSGALGLRRFRSCGRAQLLSADHRIYLDPSFLSELSKRIGSPGDFAQSYLIAHEIGHHVQNVLGTMQRFGAAKGAKDEQQRSQLQVRLELQADCYAGVWTHFVQKRDLLEAGDLENGLPAALAVGHASALDTAQRMRWFKQGLAMGDPRECDTFGEFPN